MMETNGNDIPVDLQAIEAARTLLFNGPNGPIVTRTPLVLSSPLSDQLGCRVWLKLETLQKTGSYKIRGAYNNIANLTPAQTEAGIVTASAGNHAQGVAAAAQIRGLPALIVMPADTPQIKQDNTRGFGAEVVTYDRATESREEIAAFHCQKRGAVMVPPYQAPSGSSRAELRVAWDCRSPFDAFSFRYAMARSLVRSISLGMDSQWLAGST